MCALAARVRRSLRGGPSGLDQLLRCRRALCRSRRVGRRPSLACMRRIRERKPPHVGHGALRRPAGPREIAVTALGSVAWSRTWTHNQRTRGLGWFRPRTNAARASSLIGVRRMSVPVIPPVSARSASTSRPRVANQPTSSSSGVMTVKSTEFARRGRGLLLGCGQMHWFDRSAQNEAARDQQFCATCDRRAASFASARCRRFLAAPSQPSIARQVLDGRPNTT